MPIQLIIQIILAIPSILGAIIEIIKLLKNVPPDIRPEAKARLIEIIKNAKADKFSTSSHAKDLEALIEFLKTNKK